MEHDPQHPQEYSQPPQHLHATPVGRKIGGPKKRIITAIVIVVLLAAAGTAYMLFTGNKPKAKQQPAATQNKSATTTPAMDETQAAVTKTYKSPQLNIEFTYRSDWTMRQNADKSEIILTSPQITYTKKDGGPTQGVFTLKFRNGIMPDTMKPSIENAVAVKDSEVIAYAKPSDQQRQYTNLSFAGNSGNMNYVMVTGSAGFKAGEAFGANIDLQGSVYMFAGGYGTDPNDTLTFDAVPAASFASATYTQAVDIIKSLKIY
ncbi:MAG TPA: hypothetical protein VLH86_05310 [Patescibacteria group bacterium]|nr:hypothetical protein [Patescibacteria group bacterium]